MKTRSSRINKCRQSKTTMILRERQESLICRLKLPIRSSLALRSTYYRVRKNRGKRCLSSALNPSNIQTVIHMRVMSLRMIRKLSKAFRKSCSRRCTPRVSPMESKKIRISKGKPLPFRKSNCGNKSSAV